MQSTANLYLFSVVFDRERGHVLERAVNCAEGERLTEAEIRAVMLNAFPEVRGMSQSPSQSTTTTHFFRIRRPAPALPYGSCPLSDQNFFFGISVFNQQKISDQPRLASQRARVLLLPGERPEFWGKAAYLLACILEFNEEPEIADLSLLVDRLSDSNGLPNVSYRSLNFRLADFAPPLPVFLGRALFFLWEMLLCGYAITVWCPGDSPYVSGLSMSLLRLILPAQYRGDFRPHLNFHDHDVSAFSKFRSSRVLGISNLALHQQLLCTTDAVLVLLPSGSAQDQTSYPSHFTSIAQSSKISTDGFELLIHRSLTSQSSGTRGMFCAPSHGVSPRRLVLPPDRTVLHEPDALAAHFRQLTAWALTDSPQRFPGNVSLGARKLEKLRANIQEHFA